MGLKDRESVSILWFTRQMATAAIKGLGQAQGRSLGAGLQVLGPSSAAFPDVILESWLVSRATGTQTDIPGSQTAT